jgi:hypothetical protein
VQVTVGQYEEALPRRRAGDGEPERVEDPHDRETAAQEREDGADQPNRRPWPEPVGEGGQVETTQRQGEGEDRHREHGDVQQEGRVERRSEAVDRVGVDGVAEHPDPHELSPRRLPARRHQTAGQDGDDDDEAHEVEGPEHGDDGLGISVEPVESEPGGGRSRHQHQQQAGQPPGRAESGCDDRGRAPIRAGSVRWFTIASIRLISSVKQTGPRLR